LFAHDWTVVLISLSIFFLTMRLWSNKHPAICNGVIQCIPDIKNVAATALQHVHNQAVIRAEENL